VYRHAPASLQGLDIPLIYIEQEIGHIRQVLTHGAIPTTTGTLMQISLEQAQLEVGLGIPFLETSFGFYGFLLTDIWWKAVWEFVWRNDITLTYPDQALPQPQRMNDGFIMARLCSQSSLCPSELLACNRCRLFLEAITLADITSGSGRRITDDVASLQPITSIPSRWTWPREQPSRQHDLTAWRKGLQLISSPNFFLARRDRLGAWIQEPHKWWDWFHDPFHDELYRRAPDDSWLVYTVAPTLDPHQRHTRHQLYTCTNAIPYLPDDVLRATARLDYQDYATFGGSAPDQFPDSTPFDSLPHLISSWEDSWPLLDATFPADMESLVQAIRNGTAHGCCDGSYMPELSSELGAAAWKVEDPDSGQAMWGTTQTSGTALDVNAYRSELQGIHTILMAVTAVCLFFHITEGEITIGCDNLAGVNRSNADWLKIDQTTKHADLIRAIR
jgi:hypothetical protein